MTVDTQGEPRDQMLNMEPQKDTPGEEEPGIRGGSRSVRATSCPPLADRQVRQGPWSWEWLQDHNHGEAGVILSASKRAKKGGPQGGRQKKVRQTDINGRKAGGVLRHPVHSLKKLARLPTKDRGEALKALGQCMRRRRGGDQVNRSHHESGQSTSDDSSVSGYDNNDWKNWVAVHSTDQMAVEDVRGIGQTIGVTFRGGDENMFNVLSRAGKGKLGNSGQQQGKGARKAKSC